jgi:hypothetical protein
MEQLLKMQQQSGGGGRWALRLEDLMKNLQGGG